MYPTLFIENKFQLAQIENRPKDKKGTKYIEASLCSTPNYVRWTSNFCRTFLKTIIQVTGKGWIP